MRKLLITLAALLPSLWMMGQAGGLPHLGYFHDDGIYAGTAASIAEGRGLKVESLPGEPWQVKYPPLFPAYLALGVRWEYALMFLVWILLPILMFQLWQWRGDPWLVLLLGWNVYSVVFASTALSELFATIWVLASVRFLEKDRVRASALCGAMAYLTRTALIALPAAAVLWLLWRKRWRDAVVYSAIFAPFFLAWSLFSATHMLPNLKGPWVYYISYKQIFAESMSWELFPIVLSTNVQSLIGSLGGVMFFNGGDQFWEVNFARILLFASISGLVRQIRKDGLTPYPMMTIPYMLLLVVWNFIPNERFVYPLLPLLLSGLVTELRHIYEMLQKTWEKQRGATIVIGTLVAAGAIWMVERNVVSAWMDSPSIPLSYKELNPDREKAYAWIRANTPPDANFLTYEDPALRRHTGRHGIGIHCPSRYFYTNDTKGIFAYHESLVQGMRAENLTYLMIGPNDLMQDINAADRAKILDDWKTRPDLVTVYENPRYRIRKLN